MKTTNQSVCSINRFTSCQNSFLKICDHRWKTPVIIDDTGLFLNKQKLFFHLLILYSSLTEWTNWINDLKSVPVMNRKPATCSKSLFVFT